MSAAHDRSTWDPDVLPAPADADDLVLLSNASMRARTRPGAVIALWAWQAVIALLVAWPIARGVSAVYGASPRGDGLLWEPGGVALVALLLRQRALRSAGLALFALVLVGAAFAELLPLGALLASIAFVARDRRPPTMRAALTRATQAFPTFAALLVGGAGIELILVGIAAWTSGALSDGLADNLGEARADQIAWVVGLLILAAAAVVGVLEDLARAAAIRFRVRSLRALRLALNTLARGPASVLWSWAWRAAAALAPVAIGALVATRLGGRGGTPLLVLFFVHQLVLIARVALRASWLAKAMRAVDHAHRVLRV